MDKAPGVESLSDDELAALVGFVRALVDHDEVVLREAGAYDHGDPYEFTRNWRLWDHVDLVMPPGDPRTTRGRPEEKRCSVFRNGLRSTVSTAADTEADEMEEHLRGLGYIE